VPQFLAEFPAQVLMVTAFPELYFDEDVRHADAHAAFQQALGHLRRFSLPIDDCRLTIDPIENRQWKIGNRQQPPVTSPPAVTVALFSAASSFQPPAGRKLFFAQTCAAAAELWKFQADGQGRLGLTQQTEGGVDSDLLPSPPWGRGWTATGAFTSRGGPGEGV
jgi:hypothetical protein